MINDYVIKLIENLPDDLKNSKTPLRLDLVLDGGMFNGSYLVGALYFLKEMEKRNYITIERISGCSIGSAVAILYFIDALDMMSPLYDIVKKEFKNGYKLPTIKELKIHLKDRIPSNICEKVNGKLYICYNNIKKGKKTIKSSYKDIDEIFNTIIKSSFIPYFIDGNFLYDGSVVTIFDITIGDNFINNNFIESGDSLPSGTLLFLNGQTILDSGFSIRTIGYDSYIIPNIDYYQSKNTVFVDESIIGTDALFYDYITGDSKILYRTGISSGSQLVGENFINKFVFINGQKLISGATYTGTNTINLNFPSGDNFIFIKSVPSFNYYSGNNSTVRLLKQNLNKNSSQVYLNGIKQKIGNNYIENSDFDLFSGDFFENQNNYVIYNNTDDFFV